MVKIKKGMTLIEVVVCLTILTIAALAIIAAVTRIMIAQSVSSHHAVARMMAESVLQRASLAGPPGWLTNGNTHIEYAVVGQNREPTTFYFEVEPFAVSRTRPNGDPLFSETGSSMGTLYELIVKVWWNSETAAGAVERGTQSLTVSRLYYHEV